jgi:hypothetical protein
MGDGESDILPFVLGLRGIFVSVREATQIEVSASRVWGMLSSRSGIRFTFSSKMLSSTIVSYYTAFLADRKQVWRMQSKAKQEAEDWGREARGLGSHRKVLWR